MKTGGKKKSAAGMSFEQKIRAALPHLAARELWFIEVDYTVSAITMKRLGERMEAYYCKKMKAIVAKARKRRFPAAPCPFPRALTHWLKPSESKELNALYERIQRGTFAAPSKKGVRG